MRERVLTATLFLGCAAACMAVVGGPTSGTAPAAAPADQAWFAVGDGTMAYGHHENDDDDDGNRAYLRFRVDEEGGIATGTLLCAAEGHHHRMFPDIVVTLGSVEQVDFQPGLVKFSGPGRLFDDPVHVSVRAYDKKKADRFVITATDPDGVVVFEADGELFRGDISIAARDGEVQP